MIDGSGNYVTSPAGIESLALSTFKERLENRPMKDSLEHIRKEKEELCNMRLNIAKNNKTEPWSMEHLDVVLKHLKKNKSRDPSGYANEIFRPEVAGDDLKKAILLLMNKIKSDQIFPEALEVCDISPIYKRRGSRNSFTNYRGIFRTSIFRAILDRLIYNDEYENIDMNLSDSNVGSRKARNIRDNIFVINAITNSVKKGSANPIDIHLYDVETCFDSLWLQECINDVYEAGLQNDKLPLLFLENANAKVAVKTANGVSKRTDIKNIIMQGSVWGGLLCTSTIDKLGQLAYENEQLLYWYKGSVAVPPISMVDDILAVQECSNKSVQMNSVINSFIELKKLKLSSKKCSKIHVGKVSSSCPALKVHEGAMKNSDQEKYLGDKLCSSAKLKETIDDRVSKGFGIVTEILAILDEIPLGKYRVEIGLKLRQAMFLNGVLYNSEAWHAVTNDDLKPLEKVDESLLRALLQNHPKAPLEFLYMETGSMKISNIISSRRMMYLKTILGRDDEELTKRIFREQQRNPTPGDFAELVKADFTKNNIEYKEDFITAAKVNDYKSFIRKNVKKAAFEEFKNMQAKHSKVSEIRYEKCEKFFSSV